MRFRTCPCDSLDGGSDLRNAALLPRYFERCAEVVHQVIHIFRSDRDPDQVGRNRFLLADVRWNAGVRHVVR